MVDLPEMHVSGMTRRRSISVPERGPAHRPISDHSQHTVETAQV